MRAPTGGDETPTTDFTSELYGGDTQQTFTVSHASTPLQKKLTQWKVKIFGIQGFPQNSHSKGKNASNIQINIMSTRLSMCEARAAPQVRAS
jgi:hypothetical protein